MNLIEISEQLKDVPDQLLMKEVQSPSGAYPSYLVVTEMTRRKRMRDQAMKEAPSTTVVQDLTQPSREQMMAAVAATQRGMAPSSQLVSPETPPQAQQMSQPTQRLNTPGIMASPQAMNTLAAQDVMGAQEPRRMAAGGMVAFAEGGMPKYDDRGVARFQNTGEVREYGFGPYKVFPGLDRFFSSTPLGSDYVTPTEARRREREAQGVVPTAQNVNAAAPEPRSSQADVRRVDNQPANAAAIFSANVPVAQSRGVDARNAAETKSGGKGTNVDTKTPTFSFSPITPLSLTPYVDPYAAQSQQIATNIANLKEPTEAEKAALAAEGETEFTKKVPFRMGFLEKDIEKREKDIAGRRSSNINEALIQTGLGVMRSKSPRFLGALGEGGTEGLAAYRQGLKDIREGEKEILQSKVAYANSQTLYDQNKFEAGNKKKEESVKRFERGMTLLNTQNANLARLQGQALNEAKLTQEGAVAKNTAELAQRKVEMEQFKLPYEIQQSQALAGYYNRMPQPHTGGGRTPDITPSPAEIKTAQEIARSSVMQDITSGRSTVKLMSPEFNQLVEQRTADVLAQSGKLYRPAQVGPSGGPNPVLQRNPDGSLNYVPPK